MPPTSADPGRRHQRPSRLPPGAAGRHRGLGAAVEIGAGLPAPRARPGAARRPLRRLQREPPDLGRDAGQRRAGRARRHVRGHRPDRPAHHQHLAGLRLHRDHRRLPRAAASARRDLRRAAARACPISAATRRRSISACRTPSPASSRASCCSSCSACDFLILFRVRLRAGAAGAAPEPPNDLLPHQPSWSASWPPRRRCCWRRPANWWSSAPACSISASRA